MFGIGLPEIVILMVIFLPILLVIIFIKKSKFKIWVSWSSLAHIYSVSRFVVEDEAIK